MDRRLIICTVIIFIIILLGIIANSFFEIYDREKYNYPSREVSSNDYYALEQWLKETGHQIRTEEYFYPGVFETITEKVVMVDSWLFNWHNKEELIPWIENGGVFILNIDNRYYNDSETLINEYLAGFGITVNFSLRNRNQIEEVIIDPRPYTLYDDSSPKKTEEQQKHPRPPYSIYDDLNPKFQENITEKDSYPYFQYGISFLYEPQMNLYSEEEVFLLKDANEIIRLVEVTIGKGAFLITGLPVFMNNWSLRSEANAILTWKLTGGRTDENNMGILLIQSQSRNVSYSIFGPIMERGNIIPIIISAFILILIGFWMVIPSFGLVLEEKQRSARPIKDRFIAEIRFLKKQQALNYYLNVYERDKGKINDEKNDKIYNYKDLINQYRRIFYGTKS